MQDGRWRWKEEDFGQGAENLEAFELAQGKAASVVAAAWTRVTGSARLASSELRVLSLVLHAGAIRHMFRLRDCRRLWL